MTTAGAAGGADELVAGVIWGYPLLAVHRTLRASTPVGPEGLVLRTRLSDGRDRSVVAPNNDTLYGSGFHDLRLGDVTVAVPPMAPGRYWSVMLLDAYTSVSYVSRRVHGNGGVTCRVTLDPARPSVEPGRPMVPIGTPTVWVLARVGVDGPADLDDAAEALRSIRITGPGHPEGGRAVEGVDDLVLLADALATDPPAPHHVPAPAGLEAQLREAAVRGSSAEVMEAVHARVVRLRHDRVVNGWGTRLAGADFGHDVLARAATARFSLAAHLPVENRSYITGIRDGRDPLRLRFPPGGLPPVDGFWSLTVYGPDQMLVANPIDRFSIGDRTPGLAWDDDGGLSIDIGASPPSGSTSNWLPAPAGPAALALRAYEGRPEVVDGSWAPPPLTPA